MFEASRLSFSQMFFYLNLVYLTATQYASCAVIILPAYLNILLFLTSLFLIGGDLDQLISVLADHMQLSQEQQEQWNEDGNGKACSILRSVIQAICRSYK